MDKKIENLFHSPILKSFDDRWLHLDKKCDVLIQKEIKKHSKDKIKPNSYHSGNLWLEKDFLEFSKFIITEAWSYLNGFGYNLKHRTPLLTELWVQEFPKEGGFHENHVHGNNHVSGFYFLKCSEQTSHPIFHDPIPGKLMMDLPLLDKKQISAGQNSVKYKVKPGSMIIFPSYLPHSYIHYKGTEKFRFIHFNMQAVLNENIKVGNESTGV